MNEELFWLRIVQSVVAMVVLMTISIGGYRAYQLDKISRAQSCEQAAFMAFSGESRTINAIYACRSGGK